MGSADSTSPDFIVIPLDGIETQIELKSIPLGRLELDEDNPRISFFKDNQVVDTLSEQQIEYALMNKNPEAWRKLKDSIHNNRGIVNPIWAEPIGKSQEKKFRVVEGNSRVLAYRILGKDEPGESRWKAILAYVLPKEIKREQKDFIKLQSHLRGTTEWDAYEKAKYLYRLWEEDGWPISRLEKQTKMTEKQIEQNIEAYRLMEEQYLPPYGSDPEEVSKFSYFVEFVKDTKLQQLCDQYIGGVDGFCKWVSDKSKIPTGQDVRKLRPILENDSSRKVMIARGFDAAMEVMVLRAPHMVSGFYKDVEEVIRGMKDISSAEFEEIAAEPGGGKMKLICELAEWSQKVLNWIKRS
jgi:hypothetical protein